MEKSSTNDFDHIWRSVGEPVTDSEAYKYKNAFSCNLSLETNVIKTTPTIVLVQGVPLSILLQIQIKSHELLSFESLTTNCLLPCVYNTYKIKAQTVKPQIPKLWQNSHFQNLNKLILFLKKRENKLKPFNRIGELFKSNLKASLKYQQLMWSPTKHK